MDLKSNTPTVNLNTDSNIDSNMDSNDDLEIMDPTINDDFQEEDTIKTTIEVPNPLYVPTTGSKLNYVPYKDLATSHRNVYVLCRRDNISDTKFDTKLDVKLYDPSTSVSQLAEYGQFLTCLLAPLKVINNSTIRQGLIKIGKDIMEVFNHHKYIFNDTVLVCMMLEVTETHVMNWIKMYDYVEMDDFIKMKIFTSYYKISDKTSQKSLIEMIKNTHDFQYWADPRNCNINSNHKFFNRKFNLSFIRKWKIPVNQIDEELKKILLTFNTPATKSKLNLPNDKYPSEMTTVKPVPNVRKSNINTYTKHTNPKNTSFYGLVDVSHTNPIYEDIEELLLGRALTFQEKFYLMTHLLVSKTHCHLLLKNPKIMQATQPMWTRYAPVFKYLLGYAWVCFYNEEMIKKTKTISSDRYVFTLEQATQLPSYQIADDDPFQSPYFTLMVTENQIDFKGNFNGPKKIRNLNYGIVNPIEFKRRLNIFISGDSLIDMFEGANWSNMAITGSCMAAVLPKNNPLFLLFTSTKIGSDGNIEMADMELLRFYQEYYAHSDIDIACNHPNIMDFINHVKSTKSLIIQNLNKHQIKCTENEIDIKP